MLNSFNKFLKKNKIITGNKKKCFLPIPMQILAPD